MVPAWKVDVDSGRDVGELIGEELAARVAERSAAQRRTRMSIRVLVVEDDEDLRDTVCRYLMGAEMRVTGVADALAVEQHLAQHAVDVVVCDINLPGGSGFSIAARLRTMSNVGIVMLTARAQQEDRMLGLSLGVDHYLTKPVNLRELELLIRNLCRRVHDAAASERPSSEAQAGSAWVFNAALWTLTAPSGRVAQLSLAEYLFLNRLVVRPGEVVSREELLAALNRPSLEMYSRNLDVTVSRLRKKVEDACGEKLPVLSARGVGYVFTGRADVGG